MSLRGPVALDLDGTLLDTRPRQVAVLQDVLRQTGLAEVDGDDLWRRKREGASTLEALVSLGVDRPAAAEAARRWEADVELERWLALDRLLDGVPEALAALRSTTTPFLLTARRDAAAVAAQVERLALGFSGEDLQVVPPRSATAAKAEVLRDRAAGGFVGDTESDAEAARQAGVRFEAVGWGQRSPAFLSAAGVEVVHPDFAAACAALSRAY